MSIRCIASCFVHITQHIAFMTHVFPEEITCIITIGPYLNKKQKDRMQYGKLRTIRCLVCRQALQVHFHLHLLHSTSQETVTPTDHPTSTRGDGMREEIRGNTSHDLPDWLEEFKNNLVDKNVPEHRDTSSSFHELPSESRAKMVWGNNVYTHFLKNRNCDICLRTNITRSPCRKPITRAVLRAENFLGALWHW